MMKQGANNTINQDKSAKSKTGENNLLLMTLIGALYFSQGLPMGLAMEALPVIMRQNGVSLELLAFVPLAGLPWVLKIFWAPLVDNHWSARLGRRRSWLLAMQAILILSMIILAFIPITSDNAILMMILMAVGMTASATQDTATDGLAAERLRAGALSRANALQIGGMMAGFMVGSGGTLLFIDSLGQQTLLLLLTLFPIFAFVLALIWQEYPIEPFLSPADHVVYKARLKDCFARRGIWSLLLLAFLYGGTHAGGVSVTKLFLVDLGWTSRDTGIVTTLGGLVIIFIGSPIGSKLASYRLWFGLSSGVFIVMLGLAFWGLLALGTVSVNWGSVICATLLLNIGSGIIAVCASTLNMAFGGSGKQAGTDVTLLQSVNVVGEMMLAGMVIGLAAMLGYGMMFLLVAAGCLFILLAARLVKARLSPAALAPLKTNNS
ncbi:MFS transporter [Bartonella sp. HY761]|uniref:MFS transporter n=1 Tax=Bartonella sp. HY761 TaxID=2979330 RepID=UPI0021E1D9D5|nr:MFS transporter [Bartonella sp. HY761]UXN08100.1 MFS transporter [Bartonella sp. HY761]